MQKVMEKDAPVKAPGRFCNLRPSRHPSTDLRKGPSGMNLIISQKIPLKKYHQRSIDISGNMR